MLILDLEIISTAKANSKFIELICELSIVSFKSSNFSDVEIKVIWGKGLRNNAFLYLSLDFVLISWFRRHFNNKIIAT